MKLSIFIKLLLVPVVFFSSLGYVEAQNIGSLKDTVPAGFSFKKDLLPGDTDPDILQLQKILNADPDTTISLTGDGSIGKETTYFGTKTKQAVIKFQQKYYEEILIPAGLTQGNGNVGKSTRTKLNLLIGVLTTTDSTGRVQNRPTTANNTSAVTTSQTSQSTGMTSSSLCNFINLLINIDAISQNNASRALGIFGCASNYTSTGQTPRVDLRVNGSNGPLTFSSDRTVTVSWTSENVTSCQSAKGSRDTSGSDRVSVNESGTFVISCSGPYGTVSDSVSVRMKGDDDELSAYCFSSVTAAGLNQSISWVASPSGGPDSDYRYSWSGTDSLSGSNYSLTKSYSTTGTKNASVTVRSDDESIIVSCGNVTVASSTSSSTPTNPFTPLPGYFIPGAGSQTATTTGQVSILIGGQSEAFALQGSSYQISYDTAGLSCTATSTPKSTVWSGPLSQKSGSLFESNLSSNAGSSDVSIYGPDGTFIEKGRVNGEEFYWARFSKKGGDYPNGSYVSINGQALCVIAKTSARLETCVPLDQVKKTYSISCTMPTSTSSVSSFYTSTTTNSQLDSIVWPVVKKAVVSVQNSSTYYPFSRFLWKPVSESDGNVVVMFGPFPDEEEKAAGVATNFGGEIVGVGDCDPDDGNHYKDFAVKQSDGSTVVLGWWAGRVDFTPKMGCTILGVGWSKGKPKCTAYKPQSGTISGKYIGLVYPPTQQDCTGVAGGAESEGQLRQSGRGATSYWDPMIDGDNIGPNSRGDTDSNNDASNNGGATDSSDANSNSSSNTSCSGSRGDPNCF